MKRIQFLIVLAAVSSVCFAAGCKRSRDVPKALIGVWVADGTSKYKGASFEISSSNIIFRRGRDHLDRNTIVGLTATGKGEYESYDIRYRNFSGGIQTLSIQYYPRAGKEHIRFKYQTKIIWNRKQP